VRPESAALRAWLERLEQLPGASIELGLDRVQTVWRALGAPRPANLVLTVAGTNGKGSSVALLSSMLSAAGLRVGSYTSPHLCHYAERVCIDGKPVTDRLLVAAFERIERARGGTRLTYFEYGTLAALLIYSDSALDACVLEVGMGGRLDAVNIIDADGMLISSIGLDHQSFLGPTREAIGFEKAGIMRRGRPCVYSDPQPVLSISQHAQEIGALLYRAEHDYQFEVSRDQLLIRANGTLLELPLPLLRAPVQARNAAASAFLLWLLRDRWPFSCEALRTGIRQAQIKGRLQQLSQQPEVWLDVAHNPEAAQSLAQWLRQQPDKPTHAVFGALADKDVAGIVDALREDIDQWWLVDLSACSPRARSPDVLSTFLEGTRWQVADSLEVALAEAGAEREARTLVFGSFVLAGEVLGMWKAR
jgi:dihydrofolate synthase/folylpolyglutamate synthase